MRTIIQIIIKDGYNNEIILCNNENTLSKNLKLLFIYQLMKKRFSQDFDQETDNKICLKNPRIPKQMYYK